MQKQTSIFHSIMTQVFNAFVLPMAIIRILILTNRKELMGDHKAGLFFNTGIVLSLIIDQ